MPSSRATSSILNGLLKFMRSFLDRANHAERVTAERGEVAQAAGLRMRVGAKCFWKFRPA